MGTREATKQHSCHSYGQPGFPAALLPLSAMLLCPQVRVSLHVLSPAGAMREFWP